MINKETVIAHGVTVLDSTISNKAMNSPLQAKDLPEQWQAQKALY